MKPSYEIIWSNCLSVIKENVPQISFKTWFDPIVPIKVEKDILTIQVPSAFFYEYLEEHFIDLLRSTIKSQLGHSAKLEYSVIVDTPHKKNQQPLTQKLPSNNKTDLRNRPVSVPNNSAEKPLVRNPFVIPGIKKLNVDPQLNSAYSFDNYVEGECNRLARSAGLAVAKNPGKTAFNPLFLYGNSGLGKTHLAQAIGIDVKKYFPEKTVLYLNANKFQTQFTESVRNNTVNDFLNFYQMIDVLIIDDVQEFAGKEGTQNTFFHIFNHLHQLNKQLILTADKPPVEIKGMEDRLLSRFKWGLSADVHIPNYDTRKAILKQKVYKDGISITDDVIDYLAGNISNNVRELEGALISLLAQATLNKKEITIDVATSIVEKLVRKPTKELSVDSIQKTVCEYFGLQMDVLQSKTRKREIVQARQVAMYFSKSLTGSSLSAIGLQIGKKDHATVLHACKTVNNLIETNKDFKSQMQEIEAQIKM
ncbi:chromosomal replication initiator protein DnaA [Saccharicrinis aurantiacus]|uniref:chromosomal replication initiator protein DnaA n=1 Tax=Saccharicrinis aurantiacus TaxID=1849719 RepID=UPI00094FBADE|nr:chromosomal replication initiator protein DnaA [Saccharicrinis aurantiacus]